MNNPDIINEDRCNSSSPTNLLRARIDELLAQDMPESAKRSSGNLISPC